jgi:hypothetical protein
MRKVYASQENTQHKNAHFQGLTPFADRSLAQPGGLRDLVLGSSGLLNVCYYITVCRADEVVFVTHSQLVLKPDQMNPRLCKSNFSSPTT